MTRRARWIGIDARAATALEASCRGLAEAQPADAEPIAIWSVARVPFHFGSGDDAMWADAGQPLCVLVVPVRLAPGRAQRWVAWGLAPVLATCRAFGVQAYLEGHELRAAGRSIGGAGCATVGACAVIAISLPGELGADRMVQARLRLAIESQFGWEFDTSWPSAPEHRAVAEVVAEVASWAG